MGPSDSAIDERTSSRRLEQSYAQEIFVQRLQLVLMSCQVVWTLGVALLFAIFPCRLAGIDPQHTWVVRDISAAADQRSLQRAPAHFAHKNMVYMSSFIGFTHDLPMIYPLFIHYHI